MSRLLNELRRYDGLAASNTYTLRDGKGHPRGTKSKSETTELSKLVQRETGKTGERTPERQGQHKQ